LNRCSTECGATPHSGQTSDTPVVMWAMYDFKSRQWPERSWASVVRTDQERKLSSGEMSGGGVPRTLVWRIVEYCFCDCLGVEWAQTVEVDLDVVDAFVSDRQNLCVIFLEGGSFFSWLKRPSGYAAESKGQGDNTLTLIGTFLRTAKTIRFDSKCRIMDNMQFDLKRKKHYSHLTSFISLRQSHFLIHHGLPSLSLCQY